MDIGTLLSLDEEVRERLNVRPYLPRSGKLNAVAPWSGQSSLPLNAQVVSASAVSTQAPNATNSSTNPSGKAQGAYILRTSQQPVSIQSAVGGQLAANGMLPTQMHKEDAQALPLISQHENDQATFAAQATTTKHKGSAVLDATIAVDAVVLGAFALAPFVEFAERRWNRNVEDVQGTKEWLQKLHANMDAVHEKVNAEDHAGRKGWQASHPNAHPPSRVPINGGAGHEHEYFLHGTIIHDEKDPGFLVIDTKPPQAIRDAGIQRLAYYFKSMPSAGYGQPTFDRAVTLARERIVKSLTHENASTFPHEWKSILNPIDGELGENHKHCAETSDHKSLGSNRAHELLKHYEYTPEGLSKQGWKGKFDPNPVECSWEQMRDFQLGYRKALSPNPSDRKWGAVKDRVRLYGKGMFQTANRPREQGEKGGRTLWTSLPFTVLIGSAVAGSAVVAMDYTANSSKKSA